MKVTPGFSRSLYVEALSPHAITSAVPPSHRSLVRSIDRVPAEDVAALYSPCQDFPLLFWVRVTRGTYKNNIGYVESWNGDKVEILLVPRERPYDNDHSRKLLFDVEAACRAGCTVVEGTSGTGIVTCGCLISRGYSISLL